MSVRFAVGAVSDVGVLRDLNQDSFLASGVLAAVADGMGGHRGGEVASQIAVETLMVSFAPPTFEKLIGAVKAANAEIIAQAAVDPELHGMGTTLCAMAVIPASDPAAARAAGGTDHVLGVVNVGDSRLYRLHNGKLEQLTEDHSLVESMVREGRLTREEADVHPQRNIVTRALGVADLVDVDAFTLAPEANTRFLLCSDGLFNEVDDAAIATILGSVTNPDEAAQALVVAANGNGGRDNITTLVVDVQVAAVEEEQTSNDTTDPTIDDDPSVSSVTMGGAAADPSLRNPTTAPNGAAQVDPTSVAPAGSLSPEAPKRRWWRRG